MRKANKYKLSNSGKEKMAIPGGSRFIIITIFVSMLFLLVSPSVTAEDFTCESNIHNVAAAKTAIIKQTCGNCTYNNITSIIYQSNLQLLNQRAMLKNGIEYTHNFTDTSRIGDYIVNGFGDIDGIVTPWAICFTVTGKGGTNNTLWVMLAGLALIIAIITFGFYIEDAYVVALGGLLLTSLGLYTFFNGYGVVRDELTKALSLVTTLLGGYIALRSTYEEINK